jgi:hypothetical protein
VWKSDGTTAGTVLVKDIHPGSEGTFLGWFTNVNGTLFFNADDGTQGVELWKAAAFSDAFNRPDSTNLNIAPNSDWTESAGDLGICGNQLWAVGATGGHPGRKSHRRPVVGWGGRHLARALRRAVEDFFVFRRTNVVAMAHGRVRTPDDGWRRPSSGWIRVAAKYT